MYNDEPTWPEVGTEDCVQLEERDDGVFVEEPDAPFVPYEIQIVDGLEDPNPAPDHDVKVEITKQTKSGLKKEYEGIVKSYDSCLQNVDSAEESSEMAKEARNPYRNREANLKGLAGPSDSA